MTPWSYGYVVSRVSYSYVGTWRRPDICAADGGITEGAMEMLRQAARAANAERVDVGGLELARIPFADVKPESHGTVMVVVAPPSVDREVPPIMMIPLSE